MNLPYGVSGFYNSAEEKPPEMDISKYKEFCYSLARSLDGELLEFSDSLYPANFCKADFKLPSSAVSLVMNKHYPILAFAAAVDAVKIEFIDFSTGNAVVPDGFTVLRPATLETQVPENLEYLPPNHLNQGELEQIKYWKPETIGQIIFNFWD